MKKFICVAFLICALLLLTACKQPDGTQTGNETDGNGEEETTAAPIDWQLPEKTEEEEAYEDQIDREDRERIGNPISIVESEDVWKKAQSLSDVKEALGGVIWLPTYMPKEENFYLYRIYTGEQTAIGSDETIPMAKIVYRGTTTDMTIQIVRETDYVEGYMSDAEPFDMAGVTAYYRSYEYGARISFEDSGYAILVDSALSDQNYMDVALSIKKQ